MNGFYHCYYYFHHRQLILFTISYIIQIPSPSHNSISQSDPSHPGDGQEKSVISKVNNKKARSQSKSPQKLSPAVCFPTASNIPFPFNSKTCIVPIQDLNSNERNAKNEMQSDQLSFDSNHAILKADGQDGQAALAEESVSDDNGWTKGRSYSKVNMEVDNRSNREIRTDLLNLEHVQGLEQHGEEESDLGTEKSAHLFVTKKRVIIRDAATDCSSSSASSSGRGEMPCDSKIKETGITTTRPNISARVDGDVPAVVAGRGRGRKRKKDIEEVDDDYGLMWNGGWDLTVEDNGNEDTADNCFFEDTPPDYSFSSFSLPFASLDNSTATIAMKLSASISIESTAAALHDPVQTLAAIEAEPLYFMSINMRENNDGDYDIFETPEKIERTFTYTF